MVPIFSRRKGPNFAQLAGEMLAEQKLDVRDEL